MCFVVGLLFVCLLIVDVLLLCLCLLLFVFVVSPPPLFLCIVRVSSMFPHCCLFVVCKLFVLFVCMFGCLRVLRFCAFVVCCDLVVVFWGFVVFDAMCCCVDVCVFVDC